MRTRLTVQLAMGTIGWVIFGSKSGQIFIAGCDLPGTIPFVGLLRGLKNEFSRCRQSFEP
jgi:hypothetical protein